MTKFVEVLEDHIEDPSEIVDKVNDLVYALVARAVVGEFKAVHEEEKTGFEGLPDGTDPKVKAHAQNELKKLKRLIEALESVVNIDPDDLKVSIQNRYMK